MAATEKAPVVKLWTPPCTLDFANFCLRPRKGKKDGDAPKYQAVFLFDPAALETPEFAKLRAAANAKALEKWTADEIKAMSSAGRFKSPFLKGDGYIVDQPHWAGKTVIRASSKNKPGIVDAQVKPILDEAEIYSGMRVIATLNPFFYDTDGNRGVSFGLNNIQKIGDGPKLFEGGGYSRAEDDFTPIGGAALGSDAGAPDALF